MLLFTSQLQLTAEYPATPKQLLKSDGYAARP